MSSVASCGRLLVVCLASSSTSPRVLGFSAELQQQPFISALPETKDTETISPLYDTTTTSEYAKGLLDQAATNARLQTKGSSKYKKSWRNWSDQVLDLLKDQLIRTSTSETNEDGDKIFDINKTKWELGVAADVGVMPSSFTSNTFRNGYAIDFLACRSQMLADLLLTADQNESFGVEWRTRFKEKRLLQSDVTTVASIGGGPGFDHIATTLASTYLSAEDDLATGSCPATIQTNVFDYESGWEKQVQQMDKAVQTVFSDTESSVRGSCSWGGRCDITASIHDQVNFQSLKEVIPSSQLWICQYCIAENLQKLRASDFCFFTELFEEAPVGTLFLFTETTTRIWPELFETIQTKSPCMEVSLPIRTFRGKKGPHLALCKTQASTTRPVESIDAFVVEQMHAFREQQRRHDKKKTQNGWGRQTKKIRGMK